MLPTHRLTRTLCLGLTVLWTAAVAAADPSSVRVRHALPLDEEGTLVDVFAGLSGDPPEQARLLIDDFLFGTTDGPFELEAETYTVYLATPAASDDGVLSPDEVIYAQDVTVPSGLELSAVASLRIGEADRRKKRSFEVR
jgi:hypothetical protein